MKNKLLVEVIVPAAEKRFDVLIPPESKMGEVKALMTGIITELSEGKFIADATSVICDAESGALLDINMRASEIGIINGSKLMFV